MIINETQLQITGGQLRSPTTTALDLDSGTTGNILIGTSANAHSISMGNGTGGTAIVMSVGTGNLSLGANATNHQVIIGHIANTSNMDINTGAGQINITSTTGAMNIGTNATAKTITLGNTTGATALVLNSGTTGETHTSTVTTNIGVLVTANSITSGVVLRASSSAAFSGDLLSSVATGNHTGQAFNVVTTTSTAGKIAQLTGTALTTGIGVQLNATALTTGSALSIASGTGKAISITRTAAATTNPWINLIDGTDTFGLYNRAGTPEANIAADIGSLTLDTSNGDLYIKTTDTANTGWIKFTTAANAIAPFMWAGNDSVGAGSTNYVGISGGNNASATETNNQVATGALTTIIGRIRVRANGTTAASTITLRVNGANTALAITVPLGSTGVFTASAAVVIAANDLVCWQVANGAGGTMSYTGLGLRATPS